MELNGCAWQNECALQNDAVGNNKAVVLKIGINTRIYEGGRKHLKPGHWGFPERT